jgi:hypothetical protein
MSDKQGLIAIYAAVGPAGEIVKSSIGTFRSNASRFAQARRNYTVVKLAEINPSIQSRKNRLGRVSIEPQHFDTVIEVSSAPKRLGRPPSVRKTANAE